MRVTTVDLMYYKGSQIHPGHPCHVEASGPERRDGYDTLIRAIRGDLDTHTIIEIDVVDAYNGGIRTYPVARVVPYVRNVEKIKERILARRRTQYAQVLTEITRASRRSPARR